MRFYLSNRTCTIAHADLFFLVRLRRWMNSPSKGDGIIFLSRPCRPVVCTLHPSSPHSSSDPPHPRRIFRTAVSPPPYRSRGISAPWSRGETGRPFRRLPQLHHRSHVSLIRPLLVHRSKHDQRRVSSTLGGTVQRSSTDTCRRTTGFQTNGG